MTNQLPSTLVVEIDGKPQELVMWFGMLNALSVAIGDIDNLAIMATDPVLRSVVLRELLSERTETGMISTEPNLMFLKMTPDAVQDIMEWVNGHITDFFLEAATRAKKIAEDRQEKVRSLMPSPNGGVHSASKTP